MQILGEDVVFSYKDTQIQYSVTDCVYFTAKNNKFFWKYYLSKTCEAGVQPLYIIQAVLGLGAVPKHVK